MPDLEYPHWDDPRLRWGMPGLRFDAPLPSYITHPPIIKPGDKLMLTKAQSLLISRAEKAADGLNQLTGIVTLVHNPEAGIRADIAALTDASGQYDGENSNLSDANKLVATSLKDGYQFLVTAARVLRGPLGPKPSAQWAEAGWSTTSLETPKSEDEVLPHLAKTCTFLAAHSTYEVADPKVKLTAAHCIELHLALSNSISGDSDPAHAANPDRVRGRAWHEAQVMDARHTLLQTEKALQLRLRNFAGEFDDVVHDPLSPHYLTVGLPRPGDTTAPGKVLHVVLTPMGGGQLHIEADDVTGADHYIFRIKIVGTDAKYHYLDSNGQPNYIAKGLPPGATVSVQMAAVNAAGQSGPNSDPVQTAVT